jgi:hypothetical protein
MSGAYHMFHRPPRFFTGFHKIVGLSKKELYEWRGGGERERERERESKFEK